MAENLRTALYQSARPKSDGRVIAQPISIDPFKGDVPTLKLDEEWRESLGMLV